MARTKKTEGPVKAEKKTRTKPAAEPKEIIKEDPVVEVAPVGKEYTVNVGADSWLNVRDGIGKSHFVVEKLYKGDKVTVLEERNGWGKIADGLWADMTYLI